MSEAASDHYRNILVGKTPIPERGLCPNESSSNMAAMTESRGWGRFTEQPKPTMVSIVQEFYANAKETKGRVVQVRGKALE